MTIKLDPLDRLFSRLIRARDKFCKHCGRWENDFYPLECAHVYGRRSQATRWDEENAVTLCDWCHRFFTVHPKQWEAFCREKMGDEAYEALGRRARTGRPPALDAVRIELKRRLKEVESAVGY